MATKTRKLPDATVFGPMRKRVSLRFSFAGTAFLNRYADLLDPLALTPGRVLALSFLHEHPGCEQTILARALGVNQASAMSMINKLESQRMVERMAGRNKRSNALYLTKRGQVAFDKALQLEEVLSERLFGWMSEDELGTFMASVDEIKRRAAGGLHLIDVPKSGPRKRARKASVA